MSYPKVKNDNRFRIPRIWSNQELKKFAHLFKGDIVNVSAWTDEDKEGEFYKNYFINANNYFLTNFDKDKRGWQGLEGEIFLDLEKNLKKNLNYRFDVVFNHTTLEHIFKVDVAFKNLCLMSKDIVILVVPFLQEFHGNYGDYWRFTPQLIEKLFLNNGLELLYISFNEKPLTSVYVFAIASRNVKKWKTLHKAFNKNINTTYTQSPPGYFAFEKSSRSTALLKLIKNILK